MWSIFQKLFNSQPPKESVQLMLSIGYHFNQISLANSHYCIRILNSLIDFLILFSANLHCLCGATVTDENGSTTKAAHDPNEEGCKAMADADDPHVDLVQQCLVRWLYYYNNSLAE